MANMGIEFSGSFRPKADQCTFAQILLSKIEYLFENLRGVLDGKMELEALNKCREAV